jgi:hypothetical protein
VTSEDYLRRLLAGEQVRFDEADEDDSAGDDQAVDEEDAEEGSDLAERAYLEFVDGSSAKFYALVIVGEGLVRSDPWSFWWD